MSSAQAVDRDSPRLLVLGAGPAQLGLLAAARDRGLFVIAVDRDPAAPGFRFADRRAILSAEDAPAIERLAAAEHIDGVIAPGIDWPVGIAARVAERLGIPHPVEPASAVLSTSKLRQRERFAEAGVPQSRWKLVTEPNDELGFPCVVKAPDRQGQRGLSLVRDRSELAAAVEEAMATSRTRVCMIEELVDGPEVTVNAFSRAGVFHPLTVTDRFTAEPPAFGVALAHVWPSEHADGAPGVARLGGGHDAELCHAAVGVDLNRLALAAALGEQIAPEALVPTPRVGGAVVRFLVAPQGELLEVTGAEEARALEGVVDVRVYRVPGFRFGPLRRGADRAGAVLAVGASREEALERAARAADLVRFETADAEALV